VEVNHARHVDERCLLLHRGIIAARATLG
jgi:hypothetical protein